MLPPSPLTDMAGRMENRQQIKVGKGSLFIVHLTQKEKFTGITDIEMASSAKLPAPSSSLAPTPTEEVAQ